MFRNYVKDQITTWGAPWPAIIWDNVLRQGYKHKSSCGFKVNSCTGIYGSQSLVMVGTDVTDEDLFIAGVPTTHKTAASAGAPAGCKWSECGANYLVSDVFKYQPGLGSNGNLSVSYSGTCDQGHAMGIEVFRYTGDGDWRCVNNEQIRGAQLASGKHGARGQGGVGGSATITDAELRPLLSGTESKNIIVFVFDDNGRCSGSGCNQITRTMRYPVKQDGTGGISKTYSSDLNWDCGGRGHGKAHGSARTSGGLGALNPFPCDVCLISLETFNADIGEDVDPPIFNYNSCMTINAGKPLSGCSSNCCKFYFPCGDDVIVDGSDTSSCLRYDIYTPLPCMNLNITNPQTRLADCNNYSRTVNGVVSFPCAAESPTNPGGKNCCIDICSEYADTTYNGGTFNDIIDWDGCPGNYSEAPKITTAASKYSYARIKAIAEFVDSGCKCGNAVFNTWCFQNPKTLVSYTPWSSMSCATKKSHYETTYGDLFNGYEWNDTTSCAARAIADETFFCNWPELPRYNDDGSANPTWSAKVFQTCIDLNLLPMCPEITSVSPSSGLLIGGTTITISGAFLTGATSVKIGTLAATTLVIVNSTTIKANTPDGTSIGVGAKNVSVTTPYGTATLTNGFTYTTT